MGEDNVFLTDGETAASPNTGHPAHCVRPNRLRLRSVDFRYARDVSLHIGTIW